MTHVQITDVHPGSFSALGPLCPCRGDKRIQQESDQRPSRHSKGSGFYLLDSEEILECFKSEKCHSEMYILNGVSKTQE